ncbi:MAG: D-alanyl-D-alanine carboxypeptidase, partial [Oscillospiraceae bacterium]|nr:D-alanyl-D-alanine carboxypeptidase [Oscillospiraceae bacterium]
MRLFILLLICICLALPVRAEELTAEDWAILADSPVPASVSDLEIAAPSAILVERETGAVIYEKNAHDRLAPASVTKVMTLLLLAEAIDRGDLKMEDTVTCSAAASSMGGSQVYLKEGEQLPVKELLKCVVVASANDAAVALAEHLAGTESAFVALMNRRAKELGMADTVFSNCTGLPAQSEHLSSAADIAAMARELLSHSWIKDFTTIWTDSIRDGQFGLTNTNKLIRFYPGATGLKTGYTDTAGHCLAASALRDGVEYIAVVLHCASSQERFESAKALLSFAFANYTLVPCLPDQV